MADFQHGTRARFYYHSFDMSCYAEQVEQQITRSLAEYKPLCADSVIRVPGHYDSSITLSGGAFTAEFDLFMFSRLTEDGARPWVLAPAGNAFGRTAYIGESFGQNQQRVAGDDVLRLPVSKVSTGDLYLGEILKALGAPGVSPGASLDGGAASPDGAVGLLICTVLEDTLPTLNVIIQHSIDEIVWDPLITFAQLTAPGSEKKAVTGTVRKYLRATWTVGGTTPVTEFFVAIARL
jgi:hypothetical protein